MSENVTRSLALTDRAMTRILSVMENNEDIGSKFRVYVTGGGCSGSVSYTHLTLPTSR